MVKDIYRIECFDGEWTVRSKDGWDTYYFGDSRIDCEKWVLDHNGEFIEYLIEN